MRFLLTLRAVLKYFAVLVLVALGALGLAIFLHPGGPVGMALLGLLGVWCIGLVWFLHFRQRVAAVIRRWIAVVLLFCPVCFYLGWTNTHRVELYLEHRDWLTYRSEHFIVHYAPDYPRSPELATLAGIYDEVFEQNCPYLGVSLTAWIDFYVYDELDAGFAVPEWNEIFANDDQSIGHEMTHIIAYQIAGERQKIKLIDEGIATWLNHSTVVTDHHYAAWKYIQEHDLPTLSELARTRTFRRQRPQPYEPAASFVGYLITNYGVDAFRQLWKANARYPEFYAAIEDFGWAQHFSFIPGERAQFEASVLAVYGHTLDELDRQWRAWLVERYGQ